MGLSIGPMLVAWVTDPSAIWDRASHKITL